MDEVMYREEQWKSSTSTILWATMASIIASMLPTVVFFLALLDSDFFYELSDSTFFNGIVNLAACGFGIVALMSVYKFRDIQTTADDRSGVSVLAVGYILLVVSDGLNLIWSLSDSESLFVPMVVLLAMVGNLICWIIGGTTLKNKSSWSEVGKGGASYIAKSCYSDIGFLLLVTIAIVLVLDDGISKATVKFMGWSIVILGYYYFYMYRGWKWIKDAYDSNSESYAEYEKSNSTAEVSNVSEEPHPNVAAVQQPAPQPMQQPAPQPMQQPAPQPMQQPAPQPMQQPVPRPMQQPAPQPMQQPMPRPMQQPAPQPMQQPVPQPMQQPAPRPMPQQQFQHPQYRQPVANQRKFCPNCGTPLLAPSHFCSCCGTRL